MEIQLYQLYNKDNEQECLIQTYTQKLDNNFVDNFVAKCWHDFYHSDEYELDDFDYYLEEIAKIKGIDLKAERVFSLDIYP